MTQQKSKKRMAERRAHRRRQSQVRLMIGITLAAVIVVGVIALITLRPTTAPEVADFSGVPQEIDRSGAPGIAIGEQSAPVTLIEYSDFSCSHCENLSGTISDLIDRYVREGQLRVVYKPVSFIGGSNSESASRAAICAAEQGKGWEMIDFIWGLSGPANYGLPYFTGIDPNAGLDVASFRQCFAAPKTAQTVQDVNDEALDSGINSTPTVFVNGTQAQATAVALTQAIEAALGD